MGKRCSRKGFGGNRKRRQKQTKSLKELVRLIKHKKSGIGRREEEKKKKEEMFNSHERIRRKDVN